MGIRGWIGGGAYDDWTAKAEQMQSRSRTGLVHVETEVTGSTQLFHELRVGTDEFWFLMGEDRWGLLTMLIRRWI